MNPADPSTDEQPVLVLAAGWRSGSTHLQRLLMASGELHVWGEPWDRRPFVALLAELDAVVDERWPTHDHRVRPAPADVASTWVGVMAPDVDQVRRAQRAFLRTALEPPDGSPARRWGAKHVRVGAEVGRAFLGWFPEGRVVLLVRDPVAAWRSYVARGPWVRTWPDDVVAGPEAFARMWNELADGFVSWRDERVLLVRHEDVVGDPSTRRRVAAHIDVTLPRSPLPSVRGTASLPAAHGADGDVVRRTTEELAAHLGYGQRLSR